MRKILSVTFISVGLFTLSGFDLYRSQQTGWGPWVTTSCFQGLDFCVKRGSYNDYANQYQWWVKFRNRYRQTVTFNFVAKESYVATARTTDRISVPSGGENSGWFYLSEANTVNVFVDGLRFGSDDWGTPYAVCDQ